MFTIHMEPTAVVRAEGPREVPVHTLLTREIRPTRNWHEWLQLWQKAETAGQMISLLHEGFDVPLSRFEHMDLEYKPEDRLRFYFEIADGWADYDLLYLQGDGNEKYFVGCDQNWNREYKSSAQMRQMVARKAFDMLCSKFFKEGTACEGEHRLKHRLSDDEFSNYFNRIVFGPMYPVILHFFRPEKAKYSHRNDIGPRNLRNTDSCGDKEKIAVTFLNNLGQWLYSFRQTKTPHVFQRKREEIEAEQKEIDKDQVLVDSGKPMILEFWNMHNMLNQLRNRLTELDETSLAKLREIALREKLDTYMREIEIEKDRPVKTIEEAILAGSRAALLLKEREILLQEQNRLQKAAAHRKRVKETEKRLEKLKSKAS